MGKKRKVGEPIKDLGIVGFSLFWIFNLKKKKKKKKILMGFLGYPR
jgi:hypothetical protein